MTKKRQLTINDATKEELIQYFFVPEGFGGGFRIPAMKDSFLMWLQSKRNGEILDAYETSSDAMLKSLHEYIEFVKQANDEPDIERKLELLQKGNEAYKRYETACKQRDRMGEKFTEAME